MRTGIEKDPRICGGDARIRQTRIPVWTLERMRQLGVNDGEIRDCFPGLTTSDLATAWDYVKAHREEIERAIKANEE